MVTKISADSKYLQAPPVVAELSELSARLGNDSTLVQGGGGNLSVKSGDVLWVKASGFWLAQAAQQSIFVPVALPPLRDAMTSNLKDEIAVQVMGNSTLRPSIETTLHAALPHPVVVHVHSVNAIAWSVQPEQRQQLDSRLEGLRWAWIPYARPGASLTKAICTESARLADILILANHGIVVGADNCTAALDLLSDLEHRLVIPPRPAPVPDKSALAQFAKIYGMTLPEDETIHAIAADDQNLALAAGGPLYPDHCVFLGMGVPIQQNQCLTLHPAKTPLTTSAECPYLLIAGTGVLVRRRLEAGALAMLRCWSDVLARIPPNRPVRFLSATECGELLGWEAEDYRKKLRHSSAH